MVRIAKLKNLTHCVVIAVALVAVLSQVTYGKPLHRVLANGAQIVVEENHSSPVATVRFYVGVGSVFEADYLGAGISHLVEHCCGRGTATRTATDIDEAEAAIGGQVNAYTSHDHTCYHITTLGAWTARAVDLLGDYVLGATFPEEEVANQVEVVTREIARIEDDPARAAYELFNQTMFRRHPQRYRVIGYQADFAKLNRDDLIKFHRQHYMPDNLVAVAVGDFEAEQIADQLETVLSGYPRQPGQRAALSTEAGPTTIRRTEHERDGLQRARLMIGWRTIDLFDSDLYALDVLAYVLGKGDSARLPYLLRDKLGLVDNVNVWSHTPAYDAGTFVVSATLDPSKIQPTERQVLENVQRVHRELITDEELDRAKRQKQAMLIYAQETPEGRAEMLGTDLLCAGDLGFTDKYVARIREVTAEQVRQVARKYLQPDRYVITAMLPPHSRQKSKTQQPSESVPTTKKYVLDNGLTVVIRTEPNAPAVHIATATRAGLRYENEQNNGITRLMAQMLTRGTQQRSHQEITTTVDNRGASIDCYSGRNSFGLTARCLPEDYEVVLSIVADCLQNASFPPNQFRRVQQLALAQIAAQQENADQVAEKLLRATLFQQHPYRFTEIGAQASVKRLTAEELQKFHKQVCQPASTILLVQGPIEFSEVRKLVADEFEQWPEIEHQEPQIPTEPPLTESRTKTVERSQKQAIIYYGFIGPQVDDEYRYIRDVMTAVLGSMTGRLHTILRGKGLVYATFAYAICGLDPGYYAIYAATAPEKVEQVQQIIEENIAQMGAELVSDEELAKAKVGCLSREQISLADPGLRAQRQALDELYGLGYDNYQDYQQQIEAVTAEQIRDYAQQLLDLQACAVVVTRSQTD